MKALNGVCVLVRVGIHVLFVCGHSFYLHVIVCACVCACLCVCVSLCVCVCVCVNLCEVKRDMSQAELLLVLPHCVSAGIAVVNFQTNGKCQPPVDPEITPRPDIDPPR